MKPLIVANWKMNPLTLAEAKLLFNKVKKTQAVICPPFIYIDTLKANGAQDVFWEERGVYTGEISPLMLKEMGVKYVIIGHSERRKYLGETDEMIDKKIKAVLEVGLKPILCIDKISQLKKDLKGVIVAYEPLFAISTGKPCSLDKAKKMRIAINGKLDKNTLIIYGGSVNSQNAQNFIKKAGFQGLLVGELSLNPREFIKIIKAVSQA